MKSSLSFKKITAGLITPDPVPLAPLRSLFSARKKGRDQGMEASSAPGKPTRELKRSFSTASRLASRDSTTAAEGRRSVSSDSRSNSFSARSADATTTATSSPAKKVPDPATLLPNTAVYSCGDGRYKFVAPKGFQEISDQKSQKPR